MIDLVKRFFAKGKGAHLTDEGKTEYHDVRVAVCVLLLEMANTDGEFSASERENVISLLRRQYQLSDEHIADHFPNAKWVATDRLQELPVPRLIEKFMDQHSQ